MTTATTQSPTSQEVPSLSVTGRLPAGLAFVDNGDGTGTISGTPTTAGTVMVRVRATNEVSPQATQDGHPHGGLIAVAIDGAVVDLRVRDRVVDVAATVGPASPASQITMPVTPPATNRRR